ncbi:hypothetical protein Hanom_Chr00s000001g01593951 [Helianthus anomalus]
MIATHLCVSFQLMIMMLRLSSRLQVDPVLLLLNISATNYQQVTTRLTNKKSN